MIIAVDTGGTKTLVASFKANKKSSESHRFATPKNPDRYIETLSQLILDEYDLEKATAISVASRGLIENNAVVTDSVVLGWKSFQLVDKLRAKLQTKLPILLENDANIAGLAEIHALAVQPKIGLYITISTGIGTGIIVNKVIDPNLRQSEGGHTILEFDGILRSWESFASGRAIYETYGKYAHDIDDPKVWEAIADKISRGLFSIIPLLQPEVIVLGGSIGTHFSRYEKQLKYLLSEYLLESDKLPLMVQARHPQKAVLYGCNIYANQLIK